MYCYDFNIESKIEHIVYSNNFYYFFTQRTFYQVEINFEELTISIKRTINLSKQFKNEYTIKSIHHSEKSDYIHILLRTKNSSKIVRYNFDEHQFMVFQINKEIHFLQIADNYPFILNFVSKNKVFYYTFDKDKEEEYTNEINNYEWDLKMIEIKNEDILLRCSSKNPITAFKIDADSQYFMVYEHTNINKYYFNENSSLISECHGFNIDSKIIKFSEDLNFMIK